MATANELAWRDPHGVLHLRGDPVRLQWSFDELVSGDGHALSVTFQCSVQALDAPAEKKILGEVFLARSVLVRPEDVVQHFAPTLQSGAAAAVAKCNASEIAGVSSPPPLLEALKKAATKAAFNCGMEVKAPFSVEVASKTLDQARVEELHRSIAERRAAGQVEHFQRAADLLKQFNAIRASAPDLSAADVLRQLNVADQGQLLQTLLLASGKEKPTDAVWAVAGPSLLRIDPRTTPCPCDNVAVPTDLGPLRSVQTAGQSLLVGARAGVIQMDRGDASKMVCYAEPSITSQTGFNRVILTADQKRIWASHAEAGLVSWTVGHPHGPTMALKPDELGGSAPRNLQLLDGNRLIFSSGNKLVLINAAAEASGAVLGSALASREIVAVLPHQQRIFVVLSDGTIEFRDAQSLQLNRQEKRCGAASSAALLPWMGSVRILIATLDGPICCMGPDDELVTQYLSRYRGFKAIGAAADVIAALTDDRQRVVLWNTWNAREPLCDTYVTALAKHRCADVDV